jgi:hypothetical protein
MYLYIIYDTKFHFHIYKIPITDDYWYVLIFEGWVIADLQKICVNLTGATSSRIKAELVVTTIAAND